MYDDAKRGIAFEFAEHATAGSRCVVVMLHPTGKMGDVDFANRENINLVLNLATSENVNEVKTLSCLNANMLPVATLEGRRSSLCDIVRVAIKGRDLFFVMTAEGNDEFLDDCVSQGSRFLAIEELS